ncbi:MAG: transporter substrate-binding domain-containing protein [Desulfobacterales bacterium]|nr:MAG: transporter substrate-binding domain-containing protein [Desulfobacterales bacterium]
MIFKQNKRLPILALILILIGLPAAVAQSDSTLKVGISPFSPFVILSTREPAGMSIDLWQTLARGLNLDFEYVQCKGVADKLKRLKEGSVDIAIGGITITEGREEVFDFTHPVFHTGLDILIPSAERPSLLGLVSSLFKGHKIYVLFGLLILIIVAGNVIWLVERSTKRRITTFDKRYFPGVFEGMYWALITASTIGYGDKVPHRWIGRILAAIIIIIALPLFGYFVAELSSDLTTANLKSNINGPQDLWGRRVAVVEGTTSYSYMKKERSYLTVYDKVEDTINALLQGEVEAVVYDAPNLLYYANGAGRGKVTVVGKIFEPQDYGLAVPQGSPLREKLNRAILKLVESGELKRIRANWFGEQGSR